MATTEKFTKKIKTKFTKKAAVDGCIVPADKTTPTPSDLPSIPKRSYKVPSLIPNEDKLIENNLNVLLIGLHGTGKTESVLALAARHGLRVKSFNCATMDPYTDLVGVPMPGTDSEGREVLRMVRPRAIDEADLLFFDELNRARPETRNAVFEVINNRTINGEPLPNLRASWAAVNPPGDKYDVDELDPALMDRFDLYIEFKPRPSVDYMQTKMPLEVAKALVSWWNDHNVAQRDTYISPRRLVKIGQVYEATREKRALIAALPPGGIYDHGKLWEMLCEATSPAAIRARMTPPLPPRADETTPKLKSAREDDPLKAAREDVYRTILAKETVEESVLETLTRKADLAAAETHTLGAALPDRHKRPVTKKPESAIKSVRLPGPDRSYAELLKVTTVYNFMDTAVVDIFNDYSETIRHLEGRLTQAEMYTLLMNMSHTSREHFVSAFQYCMGVGTGTNYTRRDGAKNKHDRSIVAGCERWRGALSMVASFPIPSFRHTPR